MNRILTRAQLKKIVPYSATHLARLERAGKFPKRIKLSPSRVGWLASEVDQWIIDRAEARNNG
ncbi:AlpA family phage regulatory protein [Leisingera sp. JC11]|uniref:helix-turn-helix transcriptional regulator n=1 Tax=Leisingera sp. JC11 TaxID=3042469 RepID=UPI003453060F